MGLFGGAVDVQSVQRDYAQLFVTDEMLLAAFRSVREIAVFTNLRILLIAAAGLTTKRTVVQTIPWRSVVRYTTETSASLDDDASVALWTIGGGAPLEIRIPREAGSVLIQRVLASHCLLARG